MRMVTPSFDARLVVPSALQVDLFYDSLACAVVFGFGLAHYLLMLMLKWLTTNWTRICQWTEILGIWQPVTNAVQPPASPCYRICMLRHPWLIAPPPPPPPRVRQNLRSFHIDPASLHEWAPGNAYARGSMVKRKRAVYMAYGKYNAAAPESRLAHFLQALTAKGINPMSCVVLLQAIVMLLHVVAIAQTSFWKPLAVTPPSLLSSALYIPSFCYLSRPDRCPLGSYS